MNILEGKEKLKETTEQFDEQLSEGEKIREEGEESDRIASSIEGDGLDSETQAAIEQANSELGESYDRDITEVEESVEQTADTAQGHVESLGENKEQVERNAERYSEISGIADRNSGAAELGRSRMEGDSQEYGNLIQENEQQMERSRESARSMASAVRGLFKRG